ncbi:MAG TPA: hypothetical protein VK832_14215, partial [Burkholderiaceae bacterium]|nr:hypothetical protein [Burkholderiaceae bacterium]
MSKLVGRLLLAVGLAVSLNAAAATYNLGTLPIGETDFGINNVGKGTFSDTINFSLGSASNLETGISSLELALGGSVRFGISSLNMALYNSAGAKLGGGTDITVSNALPTGSYFAVITGIGSGSSGGKYAGAFLVS